jgi:hypothetical protein
MLTQPVFRLYDADHTVGERIPVGSSRQRFACFLTRIRCLMDDSSRRPASPDDVPLGQRLFDNVFLLLGAGLLVMLVLYTGWGLWEITSLPSGPLP